MPVTNAAIMEAQKKKKMNAKPKTGRQDKDEGEERESRFMDMDFGGEQDNIGGDFHMHPDGNFHGSFLAQQTHIPKGEADLLRKRMHKRDTGFIDPNSIFMMRWDTTGLVAMLWTAMITPYEIAFKEPKVDVSIRFVINRMFDLYFVGDMFLQFNIPYRDPQSLRLFVKDHKKIAKRYLKFWFWIDLFGSLPYDLIPLDKMNFEGADTLKMVRALRLLKWLKVLRILKGSKTFKKWEAHMTISYATLSAIKLLFLAMIVAHWLACIWGMAATSKSDRTNTWVARGDFSFGCTNIFSCETVSLYVLALYWSVMTITTVGYGDILPMSQTEYAVAIFGMAVGGAMWAYVVGTMCGMVASFNPSALQFQMDMDAVNNYLHKKNIDSHLRMRVKEFFFANRNFVETSNNSELFAGVSPGLATEIAYEVNMQWARNLPLIRQTEAEMSTTEFAYFIEMVGVKCKTVMYAPKEPIPGNVMTTIVVGLVAQEGKILHEGQCWGEQILLPEGSNFRVFRSAHSVSFVEVVSVSRAALSQIEPMHPILSRVMHQRSVQLLWQFAIKRTISLLRSGVNFDHKDEEVSNEMVELSQKKQAAQGLKVSVEDMVDELSKKVADIGQHLHSNLNSQHHMLVQCLAAHGITMPDAAQDTNRMPPPSPKELSTPTTAKKSTRNGHVHAAGHVHAGKKVIKRKKSAKAMDAAAEDPHLAA